MGSAPTRGTENNVRQRGKVGFELGSTPFLFSSEVDKLVF
jgi:hypothetical protein